MKEWTEGMKGIHHIERISHLALNVKDMDTMLDFYCRQLGMKVKFSMTADDVVAYAQWQEAQGIEISEEGRHYVEMARQTPGKPWIVYVEIAPLEFIEMFYCDPDMKDPGDLSGSYGYQHLSIQVADIHATWDSVTAAGVVPDTGISRGPDFTWQFWIHDPEGNRIEFMEYTDLSLQVVGKKRS